MATQVDRSTDTLESEFEQVCQPADPQVTQLWYNKLDNKYIIGEFIFHLLVEFLVDSDNKLNTINPCASTLVHRSEITSFPWKDETTQNLNVKTDNISI